MMYINYNDIHRRNIIIWFINEGSVKEVAKSVYAGLDRINFAVCSVNLNLKCFQDTHNNNKSFLTTRDAFEGVRAWARRQPFFYIDKAARLSSRYHSIDNLAFNILKSTINYKFKMQFRRSEIKMFSNQHVWNEYPISFLFRILFTFFRALSFLLMVYSIEATAISQSSWLFSDS